MWCFCADLSRLVSLEGFAVDLLQAVAKFLLLAFREHGSAEYKLAMDPITGGGFKVFVGDVRAVIAKE